LGILALVYFKRQGKGKGNQRSASREDYHYQRVRSQYEPQDGAPPSPGIPAMPMHDVQAQSRPQSSLSKKPSGQNGRDSPFTPPVEIRYDDVDGDVTNPGIRPVENPDLSQSSSAFNPNDSLELPVPRPRFVSTTTMGSDSMYGRPQSLFSVSSGPLLTGQNNTANRPASTYDMPPGSPRGRQNSNPRSDGRPDSTFSTSPLIRHGNSPGPSSPLSDRIPRPQDVPNIEGEELMPPPRPRFMSDANMGPRPDSSFSMGGASPVRPQSQFIDASGERPYSTAM